MDDRIGRRSFLKRSLLVGTSLIVGDQVFGRVGNTIRNELSTFTDIDLGVVEGASYYNATRKAVELLGGMRRFVNKQSKIGLLVNSRFDKPGTYANPQIAAAVVGMCYEAGAKEIVSLEDASGSYWRRATLTTELKEQADSIREPSGWSTVEIPKGKRLKKAELVRDLLECDVFINIPVFKDHEGTRFTGTLKNIMGATSYSTNRFFHQGSNAKGYYDDIEFLSECIIDANLVRRPTLCIADATELIMTNGPFGPGKIVKPRKIVAGIDGVAVDAYGTRFVGLHPEDIMMIRMAGDAGLGRVDLENLKVVGATL